MLLEVRPDGLENQIMAVADYPLMTQFLTSIDEHGEHNGSITVTFLAPGRSDKLEPLRIPLEPSTEELDPIDINMHGSPATAYRMQDRYSKWFSACFGYEVLLIYLGDNRRDVLFEDLVPAKSAAWKASITKAIPFLNSIYSVKHQLTFADCAPYLITSKTSLANVSERLPENQDADMTKFRPNIVVEGADEAWEEDFWRTVRIGDAAFAMLHNCVRCQSINIDYATGKPGTDESGQLLKKLQKDRRVDKGAKWNPVFGRYSFWAAGNTTKTMKVGDPVYILEVNKGRTVFSTLFPCS